MAPEKASTGFVQSQDGTQLYVQEWGSGQPILFLAAWTFNSKAWGEYIAAFARGGYRCLAPDRRGHGRSDAPLECYGVDVLADDVNSVMEQRNVQDAVLVAHSMGSIEAVRYLARHGSARIKKLILIAPTTPFLLRTEDNPDGVPAELMEAQYDQIASDYAKWIVDNEEPFFTPNTIAETRNWIKSMMLDVPLPIALACRRTISLADTRADLAQIDIPTLILHGEKDASAPLPLTGARTANLIKQSELIVYEDGPHALPLTHRERVIGDMQAFITR